MQIKDAMKILQFETVKNALRSVAEYNCMEIKWCNMCKLNRTGKCVSYIANDLLEFLEVNNNDQVLHRSCRD